MTETAIGYLVHGTEGLHPGSAHVRVVRRIAGWRDRDEVVFVPIIDDGGEDREGALDRLGTVLVQRDAATPRQAAALIERHDRGELRLVLELDDDFVSAPATARLLDHGYDPERLAAVHALLEASDLTIASTEALAARIPGEVVVVPNALDAELWTTLAATSEPRPDALRILYMGSYTHEEDLELLHEPMARVNAGRPVPIELETVGVVRGTGEPWHSVLEVPVESGEYPAFVAWLRRRSGRWAIGVAPLVDEAFNSAKSDLKFLEYSMLGIPTIASDSAAYRDREDEGVVIVGRDPDSWAEAIAALADDAQLRRATVRRSAEYVVRERTLDDRALRDWIAALLG